MVDYAKLFDAYIVAASFAIAAVVVAWSGRGTNLANPFPTLSYDFNKSWASNLAIFGAALGAFLSSKIFPGTSNAPAPRLVYDSRAYAVLGVLFAILIVVGPFIFRTLQKAQTGGRYQGTEGSFLLACFMTLWAALGQLFTIAALTAEAVGNIDWLTLLALAVVLLIAIAATIWYAAGTITYLLQSAQTMPAAAVGAAPPAAWLL